MQLGYNARNHCLVQPCLTGTNFLNGFEKKVWRICFKNDAFGAKTDSAKVQLRIRQRRYDENMSSLAGFRQLGQKIQAAFISEIQIKQNDVWAQSRCC